MNTPISDITKEAEAIKESVAILKRMPMNAFQVVVAGFVMTVVCIGIVVYFVNIKPAINDFKDIKENTKEIPAIKEQLIQSAMSISEIKSAQVEQGKDIKDLKMSLRILKKRDPGYGKQLDEINEYIRENKEQSFIPNIKLDDFINNFDTIQREPEIREPGKLHINVKKL